MTNFQIVCQVYRLLKSVDLSNAPKLVSLRIDRATIQIEKLILDCVCFSDKDKES